MNKIIIQMSYYSSTTLCFIDITFNSEFPKSSQDVKYVELELSQEERVFFDNLIFEGPHSQIKVIANIKPSIIAYILNKTVADNPEIFEFFFKDYPDLVITPDDHGVYPIYRYSVFHSLPGLAEYLGVSLDKFDRFFRETKSSILEFLCCFCHNNESFNWAFDNYLDCVRQREYQDPLYFHYIWSNKNARPGIERMFDLNLGTESPGHLMGCANLHDGGVEMAHAFLDRYNYTDSRWSPKQQKYIIYAVFVHSDLELGIKLCKQSFPADKMAKKLRKRTSYRLQPLLAALNFIERDMYETDYFKSSYAECRYRIYFEDSLLSRLLRFIPN